MGDFERYIDEATSMEDLQERCAVATDEWKKATLSDKYWNELKQTVRIKRSALQAADANAARSA
jgi:macrodomain Ter protein organizer (MatP/YcbG family)